MSTQAMQTLAQIAASIQGYDPDALPVTQAQAFIAQLVPRVTAVECLALRSALGRVLARDVVSPIDVPTHDNSAMDGYAVRASDLSAGADSLMPIAGTSFAGVQFSGAVPAGACVRIMTGALMPAGLDSVVPQEFTRPAADGLVSIPAGIVRCGDNRRLHGEDLARGEPALLRGRILTPADLGLLASLGQAEVAVYRRLRVAFFSTGDELRSIGEPLDAGCVYDSNRYTIWGMLSRLGVELIDLGVVRDDPAALKQAFSEAAACADAVITSGGVSVGEADHTKRIMAELGEVLFWKIAMRPGRPMAIGRIGGGISGGIIGRISGGTGGQPGAEGRSDGPGQPAMLFGLPGNPVAVMVTFYAFVRQALLTMSGATPQPMLLLRAVSQENLRKKPGRTEYQRGIVSQADDGRWQVRITGAQGSGILRSMSQANGMVVLHH